MRWLGASITLCVALLPRPASAGYSHAWIWHGPPDPAAVRATIAEMRRLADARKSLLRVEATEITMILNGLGDQEHEDFVFPGAEGFHFVKTAGKPYDEVVTACLLAARDHFSPAQLEIRSDGEWDDWAAGRALYAEVLGRAPPPLGGRTGRLDPTAALRARMGPLGAWTGLLYPLAMLALGVLVFARGGRGTSWGSYYLFWFLAPMALALLSMHPLVLLIIPAALVARRWMPDPWLFFKHAGQIRALEVEVRDNAENAVARRRLAAIWLEKRRPQRALPLVEQALARDPESLELHFLRGLALLGARRFEAALEPLVEVCRRDPKFRYGEAYLRAADALIALARWEEAEDALERFLDVHRSSLEGWVKLARVRRARGDADGTRKAVEEARKAWRDAPRFLRRKQLAWYLRLRFRG